MTIAQYANEVSESPRRIGAMLRGETVMRQDDLERADITLGHVHMLIRAQRQRRIHANLVAELSEYKNEDVW
ncbi:MAG: hypothetical protein H7288_01250 [Kineosporiaceae bacterium]|nr:hypothetical protein [Aeromicrobium sp.]